MAGPQGYYGHVDPPRKKNVVRQAKPRVGPAPMSDLAWAKSEMDKMLAEQRRMAELERQQAFQRLNADRSQALSRASAVRAALQGLGTGPAAQAAFSKAGDASKWYGEGFGGATETLLGQHAGEQASMLSGTGQEGSVRNEGVAVGSVLNGAFGQIPGDALQTQGGAYKTMLDQDPAIAAAQIAMDADNSFNAGVADLNSSSGSGSGGYDPSDLIDLMRDRLAYRKDLLKFKYMKNDRAYELKKRKWAQQDRKLKMLESKRDWAFKMADQAMQEGNYQKGLEYLSIAQQNAALAQDREARYSQNQAFSQDMAVRREDRLSRPKPKSSKDVDWGKLQRDIVEDMPDLVNEVDTLTGTQKVPWKRQKAFQHLWAKYSGMVKNKGQLRKLINQMLDQQYGRRAGGRNPALAPGSFSGDR